MLHAHEHACAGPRWCSGAPHLVPVGALAHNILLHALHILRLVIAGHVRHLRQEVDRKLAGRALHVCAQQRARRLLHAPHKRLLRGPQRGVERNVRLQVVSPTW